MPPHLEEAFESARLFDGPFTGPACDGGDVVLPRAWRPLTDEELAVVRALGPLVRLEVQEQEQALLTEPFGFGPRGSHDRAGDASWVGLTEEEARARGAAEGQWLRVLVREGVGLGRTADDQGAARLNLALLGGRVVAVRRF